MAVGEPVQLSSGLLTVPGSHKLLGIDVGTRMTVIRLDSGGLILHSPVPLSEELASAIESLGDVKYIVAPNRFHHLHIAACMSRFPEAVLYGVPGLPEKRKDLKFSGLLPREAPEAWKGQVEFLIIKGVPALNEVVLYHRRSKTVIFTDLIFNFTYDLTFGLKTFARLCGACKKPALGFLIRKLLIRDREKMKESLDRILKWDFDRALIAHKDIIETGAKRLVEEAFCNF